MVFSSSYEIKMLILGEDWTTKFEPDLHQLFRQDNSITHGRFSDFVGYKQFNKVLYNIVLTNLEKKNIYLNILRDKSMLYNSSVTEFVLNNIFRFMSWDLIT